MAKSVTSPQTQQVARVSKILRSQELGKPPASVAARLQPGTSFFWFTLLSGDARLPPLIRTVCSLLSFPARHPPLRRYLCLLRLQIRRCCVSFLGLIQLIYPCESVGFGMYPVRNPAHAFRSSRKRMKAGFPGAAAALLTYPGPTFSLALI